MTDPQTSAPRTPPHAKPSIPALVVRAALFLLMVGLMGQMMIASRQTPSTPEPLFTGMQSPNVAPDHTEDLRSRDVAEEGERAVREFEKMAGGNMLTFNLLRETEIYADPPPIYPDGLEELDGKTVRMAGFMSPYDSLNDLRNFMLVRNPTGCYFCAPPSPLEVVFIRWDSDRRQRFIDDPVLVEGTLRLWEDESSEEKHRYFLFVIDKAKVTAMTAKEVEDLMSTPE